jgi:hypothetical protein
MVWHEQEGDDNEALKPWKTNLDYLSDMMEVVILKASVAEMRENQELSMERGYKDELTGQMIREKEAKLRVSLKPDQGGPCG